MHKLTFERRETKILSEIKEVGSRMYSPYNMDALEAKRGELRRLREDYANTETQRQTDT